VDLAKGEAVAEPDNVPDQVPPEAADERSTDEAGEKPAEPAVERPTRGLLWIAVPALLGALLGAALGALNLLRAMSLPWRPERAAVPGPADAALLGAIIGLVVGAFIWAAFPYGRGQPTASGSSDATAPPSS
jgi:hypothetical protein